MLTRSLLTLLIVTVIAGCSRTDPPHTSGPSPVPATPVPAAPQRIDKATNVSFSTYSKEWPVGWQWIDPDERDVPTPHNVKARVLSVTVPTGKDLAGDKRNAPRYMKAISGDFQIGTRVIAIPKSNFQAAGLLIYWNDGHYIRFERSFAGPDGGEGLRLRVRYGDALETVAQSESAADLSQVDLKLVRKGTIVSAYWRQDDESEWREVGETPADYPETILAGIAAYNTATAFDVQFAYIRLLPVK